VTLSEKQALEQISRKVEVVNIVLVSRLRDSLRQQGMTDDEIDAVRRKFGVYAKRRRKRARR
jgi:hypothetical protein